MRKHWPAFAAFAVLTAAYAVLNILLPINAETLTRYDLSETAARTLRLSVALPLIIIWTITMYGYLRFKNYARSIEEGGDGKALSRVADGFLALALWLPLSSLLGNAISYLRDHSPQMTEELVIARNYLTLAALFIIVYITWKGSEQLITAAKLSKRMRRMRTRLNIVASVVSIVFAYLVLFNPTQNTPPSATIPATFYLPDWLLLFTLVIPYTVMWFISVYAVANVHAYSRHVKGVIYRSALGYLAKGLAVSIISVLLVRFLSTLTSWLTGLSLRPLLMVLYLLILFIGIGSIMLAIGAKKLQKIEEV